MAGMTPVDHLSGELLTAYLDGELVSGELELVVDHLSGCESCIAEFHELKETRAWLRTLPVLEVPLRIVESVHYGPELSAYLDGELGSLEAFGVTRHLETCSHCRDELHELDSARAAIRSLPGLEPPAVLGIERVQKARVPRWRIAGVAASVAAAAIIVVGVATAGSDPVTNVDLDSFSDRHVARASVEPGFAVIPAIGPTRGAP